MPPVTCVRCFAVFQSDDARPGAAPVCPACASSVATAPAARPAPAAPRRRPRRRFPLRQAALALGAVIAVAALGAAGIVGVRALKRRLSAASVAAPAPLPAEEAVAAWRAAGILPPAAAGARPSAEAAAERAAAGWEALRADLPARRAEAVRAFREALALAPQGTEAAAGYAIALAEEHLGFLEADEIARAHRMVQDALARRGGDPRLLAAYARLLLAVPSERNLAEARAVAGRALAAAPTDPDAVLAAALAQARGDPGAAARALAAAAERIPGDRRLLSAAARAAWEAGDAGGALALARARLAQDADLPGALALTAEIDAAADRPEEARAALERWAQADPAAAEPLLLAARIRHQLERDLPGARRLLAAALARSPDDFLAARIHAHRAAIERDAGDLGAARAAVTEGLRRVPASAPVQLQAALLAFDLGEGRALREAAGTLGGRAGPRVAAELAARVAELTGEPQEAVRAYQELAERVARDPGALLEVAGALARRQGAPGPALQVARRALARDLADGRLARAPTDFWKGPADLASAARALRSVAEADPRATATAMAAAAACDLLLGHTRDADAALRAVEQADPQAPALGWLRAQLALDLAQPARALPLAQAAARASPSDAAALATLGRALEASGQLDEAARAYRAALAAAPDLVAVRLALVRILARRGEAASGRELVAGLLREAPDATAVRRAALELGKDPAAPP